MHLSNRLRIAVFFLLILCAPGAWAQEKTASLPTDWKALLSKRNDQDFSHLLAAANQLLKLDTQIIGTTLQSLSELNLSSRAIQRLELLKAYTYPFLPDQKHVEWSKSILDKVLAQTYSEGNLAGASTVLKLLSSYYAGRLEHAQSVAYMQMSLDMMRQQKDYSVEKAALMELELANFYYWAFHMDSARQILQSVLQYYESVPQDSLDFGTKFQIMTGYNTLGLCYEKLAQYNEALASFDMSMRIAETLDHSFWKALMNGNKGDVYFLQGDYTKAEPLLRTDYEESIKANDLSNAANSLQWVGRIEVIKGNPKEGLELIRKAKSMLTGLRHLEFNVRVFTSYYKAFEALGIRDSAEFYQIKAHEHELYLEREKTANQTSVINLLLTQQKQLQQTLALQKEKERIELIRNFIIALIIALILIGWLYMNRIQLQAKHKQLQANMVISSARTQLDHFTNKLIEKNQLIQSLQDQLRHKEMDALRIERIEELSQHTMLTHEDWDRFKFLFTQVYPNFFNELKDRVPDVTQAEMRMAALIRLRVTTREAARMLGISEGSVRKTQYRLRDRIKLHGDKDLFTFLHMDMDPEDKEGSANDMASNTVAQ